MNEKQLIAIVAAILAARPDNRTLEQAVAEAKDLWEIVDKGKRPPQDRNPMRGVV